MHRKQIKFEQPARLKELDPANTLIKVGLRENQVFCDIGAGTGIFVIPAAKITDKKVYALEIDDEMLGIIEEKAKLISASHIEGLLVQGARFPLPDNSVDLVLMVTVLHEINDAEEFLEEAKRILQKDGRIVVIEFHKRETMSGPPIPHRIAKDRVIELFAKIGLHMAMDFDLGENYYCVVFEG